MTLEVYTPATADRWGAVLDRFPEGTATLYHTPAYVLSWRDYEDADPTCLHLRLDGADFLYAFYKKPVPGEGASRLSDIQSPYGHGGLVCADPDPDPGLVARANAAIDAWCAEAGVVAEFVREYPGRPYLRDTRKIPVRANLFHRYAPGRDVAGSIRKRARRDVSAAVKRGCLATVTEGGEGLDAFEPLYDRLCREKGLVASHGFGPAYFDGVRRFLARQSLLVRIEAGRALVAASLCLVYRDTLIYHLSASLPEGKALLANDLLLFTLLEAGAARGCAEAFLGGGLSDSPQDSLFRFKEKFATDTTQTHIGVKVHNQPDYDRLCADWTAANPEKAAQCGRFFLKYRM